MVEEIDEVEVVAASVAGGDDGGESAGAVAGEPLSLLSAQATRTMSNVAGITICGAKEPLPIILESIYSPVRYVGNPGPWLKAELGRLESRSASGGFPPRRPRGDQGLDDRLWTSDTLLAAGAASRAPQPTEWGVRVGGLCGRFCRTPPRILHPKPVIS